MKSKATLLLLAAVAMLALCSLVAPVVQAAPPPHGSWIAPGAVHDIVVPPPPPHDIVVPPPPPHID